MKYRIKIEETNDGKILYYPQCNEFDSDILIKILLLNPFLFILIIFRNNWNGIISYQDGGIQIGATHTGSFRDNKDDAIKIIERAKNIHKAAAEEAEKKKNIQYLNKVKRVKYLNNI